MAPKASKRSSSAAVAGRPSKVARKENTAAKCREISDALEIAEKKAVPAEVVALLRSVLKHSLHVYKEERHEFQTAVLAMVEKTLGDAEAALVADVAAAEAIVNGGDDERARREAAVVEADTQLAAAVEAHKQEQDVKVEAANAFKATAAPWKEALAQQKEGDAEAVETEKAAAALNAALTSALAPLKAEGGGKKLLNLLAKELKAVRLEDSLLEAMELPLAKKPEARGAFDAVILEQLDLQVAEKQAAFQSKLQAAAPAREERAAAVTAAQDAHDAAKATSEAAADALKAAKEAEAAAKAAAAAAKDSVKSFTAEQLDAAVQLDSARQALEDFRAGPLAAFRDMLERSAPVPEPEPVPAAEAEVAPTTAAEEAPVAEATSAA